MSKKRLLCILFQAGPSASHIERLDDFYKEGYPPGPCRHPRGYAAPVGLVEQWLILVEKRFFPGGCFFSAAPLNSTAGVALFVTIAAIMNEWMGHHAPVYEAQKAGHLDPKVDPTRLAFEIHAVAMGAHWAPSYSTTATPIRRAHDCDRETAQHGDSGPRTPLTGCMSAMSCRTLRREWLKFSAPASRSTTIGIGVVTERAAGSVPRGNRASFEDILAM